MFFERKISKGEIFKAGRKGILKARQAFEKAEATDDKLATLRQDFRRYLPIIDKLFDNFYPHTFSEQDRENHLKSDFQLKGMLLSCYQSVAFLTLLEREIDKEMGIPKRNAGHVIDGYRAVLPTAKRVYLSNNNRPCPEDISPSVAA